LWPPDRGQFWPHGHNLNNFGRGPLDNAYIPNIKALGQVVSDKKIFESFILKPIYWPRDLLMQQTGTVWTTLIGDHPRIIPVKFGQISISGSREDVVWSFLYIIQCKIVTPGRVNFDPRGIIWLTLVVDL